MQNATDQSKAFKAGFAEGERWAKRQADADALQRLDDFTFELASQRQDLEDWCGCELLAPWSHAGWLAGVIIGHDDENDDRIEAERAADDLFGEDQGDVEYLRGFVEGALQGR